MIIATLKELGLLGRFCLLAFLYAALANASAEELPNLELTDYLPANVQYNPEIPTPASVLGFQVGTWHAGHDQLVRYLEQLDAASDRITLEVTGKTHEQRPLLLLTITSPSNHANLAELKRDHVALSDPDQQTAVDADTPVMTWLGYGVHGNEASAPNAALLVA